MAIAIAIVSTILAFSLVALIVNVSTVIAVIRRGGSAEIDVVANVAIIAISFGVLMGLLSQ